LTDFSTNTQTSNFMKIRTERPERTGSHLDSRDEASSRFSQFCERAWKSVPERGHLYV